MQLHFHFSLACIGEGNGNPLQCSCLENPRDGGVWWEAVCGVAQSQTRLKRLSSSSSIRSSLILALFPVKANATGIAVWPCGKFISPSLTPGFPVVKNLPANAGDARDTGLIPWSGKSPGRGHGNPLWNSCPENPMDRGAWWAKVHSVAKSQI